MENTNDEFIINNMKLVPYTINKYIEVFSNDNLEDMYQTGYVGLIKAVNTFNQNKGAWSNYAIHCIKNEILLYKRKINKYNNQLYLDETTTTEDGKVTYSHFIADKFDIEDEINAKSVLIVMNDVYNKMKENKAKRVIKYYLKYGGKQEDIAKVFNSTQSQISKMIRKYKSEVRRQINGIN